MPEAVAIQAPAKLNLALSVGPPDQDGMHPICSWMVTVDLFDELVVTRLEPDRLSRYAILWHAEAPRPRDVDWPMTRDLAVRAHLALEQRAGERLPVQLKLEKRIPVGGGLGGGSSDAAAMLRAVDELYGLGLGPGELRDVAAGLGADVPFFVEGGSALVEGFGERIEVLPACPELHAVVVMPDAACPTGRVYAAYDELGAAPLRAADVRALAAAGPHRDRLFNDLGPAALALEPRLRDPMQRLAAVAERTPLVAGSGSSLFVVCDDELHAGALARAATAQLGLPAVAVRAVPSPRPAPLAA